MCGDVSVVMCGCGSSGGVSSGDVHTFAVSTQQIPNDEMYWVVTTIVSETRSDMRAKLMKHFIKMASELSLSLWGGGGLMVTC